MNVVKPADMMGPDLTVSEDSFNVRSVKVQN